MRPGSRCHVWLHVLLCAKLAVSVFVPVTSGTFSWVREIVLGELDEGVSIVNREVSALADQRLHRV